MSSGYLLLKHNQEVNEVLLVQTADANTSLVALQAHGLGIWVECCTNKDWLNRYV